MKRMIIIRNNNCKPRSQAGLRGRCSVPGGRRPVYKVALAGGIGFAGGVGVVPREATLQAHACAGNVFGPWEDSDPLREATACAGAEGRRRPPPAPFAVWSDACAWGKVPTECLRGATIPCDVVLPAGANAR